MKKLLMLLAALLLACLLGAAAPARAEGRDAADTLVLGGESAEEILALAERPGLRYIDATASTEYEALLRLRELLPDCDIRWVYEFQGVRYPSDTTELKVTDMTGLEDALRYLPALTDVDLLEAGAKLEDLDRFDAIRPDIFWLWEFRFDWYKIRTDIRVYSSLLGYNTYFDLDHYYPIIKYCKHLRALDLGHNSITDISMIGDLQELEVLILADNRITDCSPIARLHNLVFLELFMNYSIEDYSFLNELTNIKDLNLCYCKTLDHLDFLENMPNLEFAMFKRTAISEEDLEPWREKMPDTIFVYYDGNPESSGSGWRMTGRNNQVRTAFTHWRDIVHYEHYNEFEFKINGGIFPITDFFKEDDPWW
ncbi:MAG: leucine-rich repeat domain-containing protein [Oscillospiraceae bacterium]|nr:leucine-rich repeat domain-containing protein [Oscillospiraceae bacterium]